MSDNLFWRNRIVDSGAADPQELAKGYNPDNWRHHPQIQRDALEDALDSIGVLQPVLFNRLSGKVIDGHLRIELAILKGQPLIPVNYVELTDDEEALALATLDAITEQAEPIPDKLAALLERTRAMTADRPGLGAMLERLKLKAGINGHQPKEDAGPQIDKAAELQKKWKVQLGDVWELDRHRIVCGDCTDRAVVESVMNGQRPEATITDPPYSFGLSSTSEMATKSGGWHDIMNNSSWFVDRYRQWAELLGGNGPMWIFGNWRTLPILMRAGFDSGFGIDSVMVWYKDWIGPGGTKALRPTYELIALTILGDYAIPDRSVEDFFKAGWSSYKPTGHRAEKPVELLSHLVSVSSVQTILDPFLGSGTTLIAAHQLNRHCFGIEIEPSFCAVALERWSQLTAQTPRRVSG